MCKCLCVGLCTWVHCLQKPEEGVWSPETRITGDYEQPGGSVGSQTPKCIVNTCNQLRISDQNAMNKLFRTRLDGIYLSQPWGWGGSRGRAEAEVQDHPGLHSKFQASQGYVVRPWLKETTNQIGLVWWLVLMIPALESLVDAGPWCSLAHQLRLLRKF